MVYLKLEQILDISKTEKINRSLKIKIKLNKRIDLILQNEPGLWDGFTVDSFIPETKIGHYMTWKHEEMASLVKAIKAVDIGLQGLGYSYDF